MDYTIKINFSDAGNSIEEKKPKCNLVDSVKNHPDWLRKVDIEEIQTCGYPVSLVTGYYSNKTGSRAGKKRKKEFTLHRQTCACCRDEYEEQEKRSNF